MSDDASTTRIVSASRLVHAPADEIFERIADPARQPEWDGNDNLAVAAEGQRVRAVGDVFTMTLTKGSERANHVVELEEGRRIAWKPGEQDGTTFGQLWRWQLEPQDEGTLVTHTYDWSGLPESDTGRIAKAKGTTAASLQASIDRLATLAERGATD